MQQDAKAQEAFLRKEMNKTTLDINSQLAEERLLAEQQVGADAACHGHIDKEATFHPFNPLQNQSGKESISRLTSRKTLRLTRLARSAACVRDLYLAFGAAMALETVQALVTALCMSFKSRVWDT